MRRLLVVLGLIASTSIASAQEFELPSLRGDSDRFLPVGPAVSWRWDGFYAGGHLGYGIASHDFRSTTKDLVAHELRQTSLEAEQNVSSWQVLGRVDTGSPSAGAFLGYGIGWECLVLGIELNYSHTNFFADAPMTPLNIATTANGLIYGVTLTGSASIHLTDMGSARMRAGFEYGNFLPYAMIGVAGARADLARSATTNVLQCDSTGFCLPFVFTESATKSGAFLYGWMTGGGVDMMIMPHIFVRGEYEFTAYSPIWTIKTQVHTARAGIGFKF